MNLPQIVALQLVLYAVLWMLCAFVMVVERRAVRHYMAYSLISGVSVLLISWRPDGPQWVTHTLASVLDVVGLVAARRGAELFLHTKPRDGEHAAIAVVGSAALFLIGTDDSSNRVALAAALAAAVMVGAAVHGWTPMRREFGSRFSLVAAGPLVAMVVVKLALSVRALGGHAVQVEGSGLASAITWSVTLISAAIFNFLFLFLLVTRMHGKMHALVTQDPLTGLLNRRGMAVQLNAEWMRFQRYQTPFTVISLDVDHFKRVNDVYGHDVGDRVLMEVARTLNVTARETDGVARMGGEEFLVLMPATSAREQANGAAKRLRDALNAATVDLPEAVKLQVTASWGVAGPLPGDCAYEEVLRRADDALYHGKRNGRDQIVLSGTTRADTGLVAGRTG